MCFTAFSGYVTQWQITSVLRMKGLDVDLANFLRHHSYSWMGLLTGVDIAHTVEGIASIYGSNVVIHIISNKLNELSWQLIW